MADEYAYKAATNLNISSGYSLSKVDMTAMGMVAQTAIASWNSAKMDAINYQMQKDNLRYQREAQAESRRHQAFMTSMNKENLKEALMSEKLALDIDQMKAEAKVRNEAQAYNYNAAPNIVRDIQRQMLRQDMYQEREHNARMQQVEVAGVDAQRSQSILYEPNEPDPLNQAAQFVTQSLQIGDAAYGRFTRGN
jgi:hypothetical protein